MLLILAEAIRIYGFLSMRQSLCRYALIFTVAGLVLTVAGSQVLRRVSWILLFMFLMFPLPGIIDNMISLPLQRIAATASVFLLQVFGSGVSQQGNILILNKDVSLGIVEACSGLRMLTAFIIVTAFIAYVVKRSRLKKAILILSSIPVAVICNVFRILGTAMITLYISAELGEKFFHDFAGLVMMPIAVSIIFGELWLIDRLVLLDAGPQDNQVIVRPRSDTACPPNSL